MDLKAANWHLFIGRFDDPAKATLNLFKILNVTAEAYFMAAGKGIENFPIEPSHTETLPGFALALGVSTKVEIGGGSLYIRGALDSYLTLALSRALFARGMILIRGAMCLFIVTIDAYAQLRLAYKREYDGTQDLFIEGRICGHYEDWLIDIEGCLSISFGAELNDPPLLPKLAVSANLVSGANVSLRGQGRLGPIDGVLGTAAIAGSGAEVPSAMPLDSVITVEMPQPPTVDPGGIGFARGFPPFAQGTHFNIGRYEGQYVLKAVRLSRRTAAGKLEQIDYGACPARWWDSTPSPNGLPTPKTLALMTRSPLSSQNAVVDPEQLAVWIDSILHGLCDPASPPQPCLYTLASQHAGPPTNGSWQSKAILRDTETERLIGRSGASDAKIGLAERKKFGKPDDPIPGFAQYPGRCRIEVDALTNAQVPVLSFYSRHVSINPPVRISTVIEIAGDVIVDGLIELLWAHSPLSNPYLLVVRILTSDGGERSITYADFINLGAVADLTDVTVQNNFHQDAEHWRFPTEGFARLAQHQRYRGYIFERIRIDTSALDIGANISVQGMTIEFNGDMPFATEIGGILGGVRFIPAAEKARFERDVVRKRATIAELQEFLAGAPIPLLEPNSTYEVTVDWDAIITNQGTTSDTSTFIFATTDDPPQSSTPYLLATFPQDREKFHSTADLPGFGLGSTDAFRILAKFPDARLKVTITEDGGSEVHDPAGRLKWHDGVLVSAADLIDTVNPPPVGFIKDSIASLPSALQNALREKLADGSLGCLGQINLPEGGIWVGFEAALRPLAGYKIRIDIVQSDGTPWPWHSAPAEPFLQWQFSTSLNPNVTALGDQLRSIRPQHKMMYKPLALLFNDSGEGVLPEKLFEDRLAALIGERPDRANEARITILWQNDHPTDPLLARAVLIESKEPLRRVTKGVRIGLLSEGEPGSMVAEPQDMLLQSIDETAGSRVRGVTYSSSGFSAILALDESGANDAAIILTRHDVERIPPATAQTSALTIAAAALAPRPRPNL